MCGCVMKMVMEATMICDDEWCEDDRRDIGVICFFIMVVI